MYLQRSNVYNKDVESVQTMLNAALSLDRYRGKWQRIKADGYYGPETENAVRAFQSSHNPRIDQTGIVGDTTYNALKQTGPFLSAAPPQCYMSAAPTSIIKTAPISPYKPLAVKDTLKSAYGVSSKAIGGAYTLEKMVTSSKEEAGLAYILSKWEEVLTEQHQGLLRRLNKFPAKKAMRTRNIMRQMASCQKFLQKASRFGIVSATKEFGDKLTKIEAIECIKELGEMIKNSPLTKGLSAMNKILSKVKAIIKPVIDILNKIPGLKYLSVIEKIIKATKTMVQGDFEYAFALYMDGIRELVEQIVIDAIVAALVALGGWVALVVAVIVIIIALIVDYFWFSDNPGEALTDKYLGIPTHNYMVENARATHRIITETH